MSDIGIICEMNPLHRGHQYLLGEARRQGAERIVCVMSGNTVQRGELAVADKYTRAEALIRCGADLVLELPYPWSSASAEAFARAGISILRHVCEGVIFGSECGDLKRLQAAATLAASADFRKKYRDALSEGKQAAGTYYELLRKGGAGVLSSNDLLGVEYLRAAKELSVRLSFSTVPRQGADYRSDRTEGEDYPSALAIRALWQKGEFAQGESYLPKESAAVFRRSWENGSLSDPKELDGAILSFFRLCDPQALSMIAGAESGLVNRFCEGAHQSISAEEMMERIRTKRYTDSHIRRVLLYCMTGVMAEDLQALPAYTTLLAANTKGRELLAQKRKEGAFLVVTKPSDAPSDTRQFLLTQKADALFTLAARKKRATGAMMKATPYICE